MSIETAIEVLEIIKRTSSAGIDSMIPALSALGGLPARGVQCPISADDMFRLFGRVGAKKRLTVYPGKVRKGMEEEEWIYPKDRVDIPDDLPDCVLETEIWIQTDPPIDPSNEWKIGDLATLVRCFQSSPREFEVNGVFPRRIYGFQNGYCICAHSPKKGRGVIEIVQEIPKGEPILITKLVGKIPFH